MTASSSKKKPSKIKGDGVKRLSKESGKDHLPATVSAPGANALQLYLREMARFPLLSPEQEKELTARYYETKDPELFRRIVQANLRFVVKMAFEYARYGAKVLDLIQEGNVGLMKAVQDFNPYKDVRLTTYAVWWIRSFMQDYLLRNWSLVRIGTTAAQKKLFYRLKKEQEKYARLGINAEPLQIAHDLGVEKEDVELMSERLSGGDVSMDAPIGRERDGRPLTLEGTVADASALPGESLEESEQADLFKKALTEFRTQLDEREIVILEERLLSENPKTLIEIGELYNFSKERARQLEERIKKKLKDFLAEKYPDISMG
jgi:RNA polymerase sigma-32 factor